MKLEELKGLFALAQIEILDQWEIANQYWPEAYVQLRNENPWWLVKTKFGIIQIGMRKRVLSIDWSDTPVRKIVTAENVTKSETMVHAWNRPDAVAYLSTLKEAMDDLIPGRITKLTEKDENMIKDVLKMLDREPAFMALIARGQDISAKEMDKWLDEVFIKLGNGRVTFENNG